MTQWFHCTPYLKHCSPRAQTTMCLAEKQEGNCKCDFLLQTAAHLGFLALACVRSQTTFSCPFSVSQSLIALMVILVGVRPAVLSSSGVPYPSSMSSTPARNIAHPFPVFLSYRASVPCEALYLNCCGADPWDKKNSFPSCLHTSLRTCFSRLHASQLSIAPYCVVSSEHASKIHMFPKGHVDLNSERTFHWIRMLKR